MLKRVFGLSCCQINNWFGVLLRRGVMLCSVYCVVKVRSCVCVCCIVSVLHGKCYCFVVLRYVLLEMVFKGARTLHYLI